MTTARIEAAIAFVKLRELARALRDGTTLAWCVAEAARLPPGRTMAEQLQYFWEAAAALPDGAWAMCDVLRMAGELGEESVHCDRCVGMWYFASRSPEAFAREQAKPCGCGRLLLARAPRLADVVFGR